MNEKLHDLMTALRLKGMDGILDEEIHRAEKDGISASEVLFRLVTFHVIGPTPFHIN